VKDGPLLSAFQCASLKANGRKQAPVKGTAHEIDFEPAVKIDDLEEGRSWLLSEIDPFVPHKAWGLCLARGEEPYTGCVDINDLENLKRAGRAIAQDLRFIPQGPLSHYLAQAQAEGTLNL